MFYYINNENITTYAMFSPFLIPSYRRFAPWSLACWRTANELNDQPKTPWRHSIREIVRALEDTGWECKLQPTPDSQRRPGSVQSLQISAMHRRDCVYCIIWEGGWDGHAATEPSYCHVRIRGDIPARCGGLPGLLSVLADSTGRA